MECRTLPMLKFGQIFVPQETFEIIFSYESYIQNKTYQSFEYAQSTKYYICCRFAQTYSYKCTKSNPMFCIVSSQIDEIYGISLSHLSATTQSHDCIKFTFSVL